MLTFHDEDLGITIETDTAEEFAQALAAHHRTYHETVSGPTEPLNIQFIDKVHGVDAGSPKFDDRDALANQQKLNPLHSTHVGSNAEAFAAIKAGAPCMGSAIGSGDAQGHACNPFFAIKNPDMEPWNGLGPIQKSYTFKSADARKNYNFFYTWYQKLDSEFTLKWSGHAATFKREDALRFAADALCKLIEDPAVLERSELYQQRMAAISTAALGFWTEDQPLHMDYRTPALEQVADLYRKYVSQADKLRAALAPSEEPMQAVEQHYLERGYSDEISTLKNQREQLAMQCEELKAKVARLEQKNACQAGNVKHLAESLRKASENVENREKQLLSLNKKYQKLRAKVLDTP